MLKTMIESVNLVGINAAVELRKANFNSHWAGVKKRGQG